MYQRISEERDIPSRNEPPKTYKRNKSPAAEYSHNETDDDELSRDSIQLQIRNVERTEQEGKERGTS